MEPAMVRVFILEQTPELFQVHLTVIRARIMATIAHLRLVPGLSVLLSRFQVLLLRVKVLVLLLCLRAMEAAVHGHPEVVVATQPQLSAPQ
jgi:hypothetical protein